MVVPLTKRRGSFFYVESLAVSEDDPGVVHSRARPCTAAAPRTAVYCMYRNDTVRKIRQSGEQSQPGKRWRSFVKAVGGFFLCGKALFCPHSRTHAPLKIQTACCCCLIFTCAVFLIRTTLGGEAVLVVGLL